MQDFVLDINISYFHGHDLICFIKSMYDCVSKSMEQNPV